MKITVSVLLLLLNIITLAQGQADSLYALAKKYDSLNQTELSMHYYTTTIQADSTYLNAYFNRGVIQAQRNKFADALTDFMKFDSISSGDFEVEYMIAACYHSLNNKKLALLYVNRSLQRQGDFFDGLKLRSMLNNESGDFLNSISDINRALKLRNSPELYGLQGHNYDGIQVYSIALQNYLKAIRMGHRDVIIYNNIGVIYARSNQLDSSLNYFHRSIQLDSSFAESYYHLGNAYYDLKDSSKAFTNWKMAQTLGYTKFHYKALEFLEDN
jgi:tetratricopeptide (TPR) repeat protein